MGAHPGLDDLGVLEVGAAAAQAANLEENSPKLRCWLWRLDQAEGGGIPEARRSPVAQHHLVALGEREELRNPASGPGPTCDLTVFWRWLVPRYVVGPRPARRPARDGPWKGPLRSGRRRGEVRRESMMSGYRARMDHGSRDDHPRRTDPASSDLRGVPPPCLRRPPWPSTPRPRPSRRPASTSSDSGPASPISRPRPHRRGGRRRPAGPGQPPLHPDRRDPGPARGHRGQDAARLGLSVTSQQVLVTNGGKQAIANAFAVLCDPGDEVLVLAPYWTTYPESIALAGGVPVFVSSDEHSGFRSTVEELEAAHAANESSALRLAVESRPGPSTGARRSRRSVVGPSRRDSGS
jgi:hypothetical protein